MSSPQLEQLLARLYTDAELRRQFLDDPRAVAVSANLADDEVDAMCNIDRTGLRMAAVSFESKRAQYRRRSRLVVSVLLNIARRLSMR